MAIRDRIRELRRVKASEIIPNPKNWRTHPPAQQQAIAGMLAEVGYADALIAYEGSLGLTLIDGHLRAETTPDEEVPVLILDVSDDEADKILATLDPLASMAGRDNEKLGSLLDGISSESDGVTEMLRALVDGNYEPLTIPEFGEVTDDKYVSSINVPIYEPSGPPPEIHELYDRSTADEMRREIQDSELPEEIEAFLLDAAERHVGFNFQRIAHYYAHAPADIKALMERSALVIIDYGQAIENGLVRLKEDVDAAFYQDYPDA